MNLPNSSRLPLSAYIKSTPRQRILSQWRGQDLDAAEKACKRSEKSAADLMKGVLSGLGIERRRSESEIIKAWNHLIDPNVTAHAQPAGIVKGTLLVSVDSHVWLDEIVRYRRKEILQRLQNCFGLDLVKRISFRVSG